MFLGMVHSEDRERVKQEIEAMAHGEERSVEYRVVQCSGNMRWMMSRGGRYQSADARSILTGITFYVSKRRANEEALRTLSGRLIEAQEQERKRIARELHDSIGQQLAMIASGLDRLQSAHDVDAIKKLIKGTHDLVSDVSALSHKLHSASLEYLGLVPAIRGLCREISQHQQVEIDFRESNVPGCVPPDVALALFRITQESLHNALKYSGVRTFDVELKGSGSHLELAISDGGVGFDVNDAKASNGLGLISMRERIMALKGTISTQSEPMRGTKISARVPVSTGGPVRYSAQSDV